MNITHEALPPPEVTVPMVGWNLANSRLTEMILRYTVATPYEVSLIFPVQLGLDERIEWKFARDLLAVGVNAQTGIGDVTVEPAEKLELVEITLRGKDDEEEEDGETALWLPRPQVTDFLRQTYERVPSGHESSYALTQLNKCVEKLDFLIWKQTYPKLRTPK